MITSNLESKSHTPMTPVDPAQIRAALARGEIVRLLAEVEAGMLKPEQLLAVLEERDKGHWACRLLLSLLGR